MKLVNKFLCFSWATFRNGEVKIDLTGIMVCQKINRNGTSKNLRLNNEGIVMADNTQPVLGRWVLDSKTMVRSTKVLVVEKVLGLESE